MWIKFALELSVKTMTMPAAMRGMVLMAQINIDEKKVILIKFSII